MKRLLLLIAIILQGAIIEPAQPDSYHPSPLTSPPPQPSKGLYATARVWDDDLSFVRRFKIVELGGIDDLAGIDLSPFERVVAYEWSAGFYKDEHNPLTAWALKHPDALLTPKPNDEGAYFYDMCDEKLLQKRIAYLIERKKELGIAGYFFDWANEEFLHEPSFATLLRRFKTRHPHTTYASCLARFYAALKEAGVLIVTNQAYRNPELLEAVDYDMCESYMTQIHDSKAMANIEGTITFIPTTTFVPLEEVFEYFAHFSKLKQRYGYKQMIYMNYAAPLFEPHGDRLAAKKPTDVIYYNYVLAKLGGFYSFTEVPFDHSLERDPLYFYDLGRALEPMQKDGDLYWRRFEKGFVILAPTLRSKRYMRIKAPGLIDLKEGLSLEDEEGWTTFELSPIYYNFENRYIPQAKVFLYAH